jgi:hypothetical protein
MAVGMSRTYSVDTVPQRNFGTNNISYYMYNTSMVNSGTTITIPPGTVFKGQGVHFFNVNGALNVNGTAAAPVVMTDLRDDLYGTPPDMNQDGSLTQPTIGTNLYRIYFADVSNDAASVVNHLLARYAGWGVYMLSSSPKINGCTFDKSDWGVYLDGVSQPILDSCLFRNLTYAPMRTSLVSYPSSTVKDSISGTTHRAIGVVNETLVQDVSLIKRNFAGITNIPYAFGTYTIGTGASHDHRVSFASFMTGISPCAKASSPRGSTADSTIVFTSIRDDFYGGDTNRDSTYSSPGGYYEAGREST